MTQNVLGSGCFDNTRSSSINDTTESTVVSRRFLGSSQNTLHSKQSKRGLGGKLTPDGSLTIAYFGPRKTRRDGESRSKPTWTDADRTQLGLTLQARAEALDLAGETDRSIPIAETAMALIPWSVDDNAQPTQEQLDLGLVSPTYLQQPSIKAEAKTRKRRGCNGLSSYGKRMTRSAVALLQRLYPKNCLTFGTATIPSLPLADLQRVLANWPKITDHFFNEYRRELERKGIPWQCVRVTEIQPGRWRNHGVVGLHLHWLVPGRLKARHTWAITPAKVDELWARALAIVLGYEPRVASACRLEAPKKDLTQELVNYLAKGSAVVTEVVKAGLEAFLPTAWWGASKQLKAEIHDETLILTTDQARCLSDALPVLREVGLCWYKHLYIDRHDAASLPDGFKSYWVGTAVKFFLPWDQILKLIGLVS